MKIRWIFNCSFKEVKYHIMKKEGTFFVFLILLISTAILGFSFAAAEFHLGNNSTHLNTEYGSGAYISGTINLSLNDEPFNSPLKASFSSGTGDEITLKEFLDNNHIQGYIWSKINIGLFYENNLVCLISFSKSRFNLL